MRAIILAVAIVVASVGIANAQDYRSEIMQYVIDPCVMATARRGAVRSGISPREMAELIKAVNKDQYDRAIQMMTPTLRGKTWSQRKILYDWGRRKCIRGSLR